MEREPANNGWHAVSVTVAPEASEAIEYAFNSLDAIGTEINHLRKKDLESVTVVGYFDSVPDEDRVRDELHYALTIYGLGEDAVQQLVRTEIEDADWLAEWKKHWRPTVVGGFVIAPPWSEVEESGRIVIRIEPNMAFGTGTHETTQLCLRAIEKHYTAGDSFLDVGTGTGILAIAAARMNIARDVTGTAAMSACDTDVDSVSLARENAELNGVAAAIQFSVGSIAASTPRRDFVCANLTLDVIEPILPTLIEKAKKTLVLSGILADQRVEIESSLRKLGVSDVEVEQAGEWICAAVKNER